jgi:hypothetical protein
MINELLPEKYRDQVQGVLECYDRIVITGHLFPLCYAHGATNYLYGQKVRIFDYAQFAEPLRDDINDNRGG